MDSFDRNALLALDLLLHGLHITVICFVVTGWMFLSLRRLHLLVVLLVWLSWIALGLYLGNMGYCPITDWQWQVKTAVGERHLPPSYVEYMYHALTRKGLEDELVNKFTASILIAVTLLSLWVNRWWFRYLLKRSKKAD